VGQRCQPRVARLGLRRPGPLLGLPEYEAQDQSIIVVAVRHWLDTHDWWLLILDNADDVSLVRDFLPRAGKGHILLTTRASAQGTMTQSIGVEPMEETEGALFLLRRARVLALHAALDQATPADHATAKAIVQTLGGLPLALDQAGAYIEETGCGLSGYLERYHTQRTTLLRRRGRLVTDHPEPVATTWSLSFQRVEQTSPAAADLMRLCAFLHPDAIPEELITEGAPDLGPALQPLAGNLIALDEAMEALRAYSLVRRNPDTNTLTIHRLVQAVLRDAMNTEQQRQWAERTVRIIEHIFPNPKEMTNWKLCERYILHAQVCATWIVQWGLTLIEAPHLLNEAAIFLEDHAQYQEAEPLYYRALDIREQVLGPNHPELANSLNNLGQFYNEQARYTEAEPHLQRALKLLEQGLEPNHPHIAYPLNNLGILYFGQGRYAEAEQFFQRALNVREQVWGPNHPELANSLNNLGQLYKTQGKYAEAEPFLQRALSIYEQGLGSNHPETASGLNNLAGLYQEQGKYAETEPLYQRALDIRERVLGPNHPETAQSLNNLATLYEKQGKYAEAELLYQRALNIYGESILDFNHPDVVVVRNNYTAFLQKLLR